MDAAPMQKPTSLIVIGIIITILGALGGASAASILAFKDDPNFAPLLEQMPFSPEVHAGIGVAGALLSVIAGIGIVMGKNWARWLYVLMSIFNIAFGIAINPNAQGLIGAVFGLIILGIFSFFLFRGREDAYFKREG